MTLRSFRQIGLLSATVLAIANLAAQAQSTASSATESPSVRGVTGFECASAVQFETLEPNHIRVTLGPGVSFDGWLFRLEGVAGKTVQIEFTSQQNLSKWSTLNPMYAAASTDLNDPAMYVAGPSTGQNVTAAHVKLPDTAGQKWHYISDAKLVNKSTFTMTQAFDSDAVWIGNRVPYTPGYREAFIRGLEKNPLAKVVEIGRSNGDRPLLMVQIGGDDAAAKSKSTVVISGGEQAIQPDGMWSSQGAIEFLLGDSDAARRLRERCRFLIIPMLDPDGTARARMELPGQFRAGFRSQTAIAYANFFQRWVGEGNRLDVVLDIHNVQSHEYPHLSRAYIEGGVPRGTLAEALNTAVVARFKAANLVYSPKTQMPLPMPDRFSGWLSANYGPIEIIYEINSQDPTRHLDLGELKATGGLFAEATGDFLFTQTGTELLAEVDRVRARREKRWTNSPATQGSPNAIESESAIFRDDNPHEREPSGL